MIHMRPLRISRRVPPATFRAISGLPPAAVVLFIGALLVSCGTHERPIEDDHERPVRDTLHHDTSEVSRISQHGRCPAETCGSRSELVSGTCGQVVPDDGRIWLEGPDGKPCWCACSGTGTAPVCASERLKSEAKVNEILEMQKRMRRFGDAGPDPSPDAMGEGRPMTDKRRRTAIRDSAIWAVERARAEHVHDPAVRYMARAIDRDAARKHECYEAVAALFRYAYPVFTDTIEDNGDDYSMSQYTQRVRSWQPGDPAPAQLMKIIFPLSFINHPEVGCELIAFMFAHEIAHGLGDLEECSSSYMKVCEPNADYWGARVALRRVYQGAAYVGIARRAEEQLFRYITAIDAYPECGWEEPESYCDRNDASCGHSPRTCRASTIASARLLNAIDPCTTDWADHNDAACP